jgi:glycogen synthase
VKILMLLDNPLRSDTRVEKEARALVAAGHRVTVMTLDEDPSLPAAEERDGYRIARALDPAIRSPFRPTYRPSLGRCTARVLSEDFEVLHCHDYLTLQIGARVKRAGGRTLVYDAHEFLPGWPFYRDSARLSARIKGRVVWGHEVRGERRNIRYADVCVTVSDAISRAMRARYDLPRAPLVVRNIPDRYEVSGDRRPYTAGLGIPPTARVLVHSGSLYHTDRQLRALFGIVDSIENLVLVLFGNRSRHDDARSIAEGMGLLGRSVWVTDYISEPSRRMDVLSGAELALMHVRTAWPSHRMSFSNKFLEYSFAGLPIVAAIQEDCVALGEEYGHALFYEEDEDELLGRHLLQALRDGDSLRQDLPRLKRELSWEDEVGRLVALYEGLG